MATDIRILLMIYHAFVKVVLLAAVDLTQS